MSSSAGNQAKNSVYSEDQIRAIERSLSMDRVNGYLAESEGDKNRAVVLHEYNTEISEALFGVIQGLELALRNRIHGIMQKQTGSEKWYEQIHLEEPERAALLEANEIITDLKKTATPSRIISRLSFGFWVRLTTKTYEKDLWVPHLHKIFPMRMVRSLLCKRLLKIRELRNQIAHHERITKRDLDADYGEILEAIKWLCPTTSGWVRSTTRVEQILNRNKPRSHPENGQTVAPHSNGADAVSRPSPQILGEQN